MARRLRIAIDKAVRRQRERGMSERRGRRRKSLNFEDDNELFVCTGGFDSDVKKKIKEWVKKQLTNATFQTKFRSDKTTHLISKNVLSEKYKAAVQGNNLYHIKLFLYLQTNTNTHTQTQLPYLYSR